MSDKKYPILIFKGDEELCYGILRFFSVELKKALVSIGENVVFFDPKSDSIRDCFGKEYKAVIGFMETFFYNTLPDSDTRLFDLIVGPKFNYWPDHPAFYYQFLNCFPKDYHILTLDRNYVNYINKYYSNVTAHFLPPGACESSGFIPFEERKYNLSFLGTFVDYREALKSFNTNDDVTRAIGKTYLDYLIRFPGLTTEEAFARTLEYLGADVSTEQFLGVLQSTHRIATMGAARYYKERIIQTIVDAEITIDVFGESWKTSPFKDSQFVRIHEEVPPEKAVDIYRNSKMSLNIMTWHKDSITERVLDSMISGSISLTDVTPALKESFDDDKDIVFFSLESLEELPELIRRNMNNEEIAISGRKKVLDNHLWKNRAKDLMKIIDSIKRNRDEHNFL